MRDIIVLDTNTQLVRQTTEKVLSMPLWMKYAIDGQKINAIKALRDLAYDDTAATGRISLRHAKMIVESLVMYEETRRDV